MTEDTINEYEQVPPSPLEATALEGTVQAGVEGLSTGPRAWRATELIGDSVRIRDADIPALFGYVNDFLIQDGRIAATVVAISQADSEPEYPAYPPLGYEEGFTPESEYYDLPYSQEELDRIHPFDYERLVDQYSRGYRIQREDKRSWTKARARR